MRVPGQNSFFLRSKEILTPINAHHTFFQETRLPFVSKHTNRHSYHQICAGFQTGRKHTPLFYSQPVRSDSLTLFGRAQLLWISAWKAASASRSRPFFSSCLCKDSSTGPTYCTQYMASAESSATTSYSWHTHAHTVQCTRYNTGMMRPDPRSSCLIVGYRCNAYDPAMSNQNVNDPLVEARVI